MAKSPKDPDRLYYVGAIADDIGLSRNAISALRRRGCPFFGKRTTIRWVRDFIAKEAGAIPSPREETHVIEFFDHFVEIVRQRLAKSD